MNRKFHARDALLPNGWAADVTIEVDPAGVIRGVRVAESVGDAEILAGPVVPAMANVHSHAFQRALAGRTGHSMPEESDTFWTWRRAMYAFLGKMDADAFGDIAAQAYVEMAKAGYATVAEFHYVHHDAAGKPYADEAELAQRVIAAAEEAGLGLTLLPVFYAHAGFNGVAPTPDQRRFVHTPASYASLVQKLSSIARDRDIVVGIAPHSLRAVTAEELGHLVRLAPPGAPLHIHAAEQTREVDECYAWSRMRPVEWLLTQASVDAQWCIVHATHMTDREVSGLARSGAVAGLAPTTEADLGDGIFPGESYLAAGGSIAVGSDSNTIIDPFAELRQLEWSQRLRLRRRNVLARRADMSIGSALWLRALAGGAQALARNTGAIAEGRRADWIVLNGDDPALVAQAPADVLDAAIFGPCRRPVRDVMSGGRWIVREGVHAREAAVLVRFRDALARLASVE